jgi:fucose 4-O-acetylase-like acetyltransferase
VNSSRLKWVDNAKGIGIILVVYVHVAGGLANSGFTIDLKYYHIINSIIYSFYMRLFFFLSGVVFLTSLEKRGGVGLVLNKIDAIVYPYIFWSLLQGGTQVLFSKVTNSHVTINEVLSLLWEPRAQFWFLYALFFIYLVWSFLFSIINQKWHFLLLFVGIILYLLRKYLPNSVPLNYIYHESVFFLAGIWFSLYKKNIFDNNNILLGGSFFIFMISQYIYHFQYGSIEVYKELASLWLPFISIIFVVSLSFALSTLKLNWLSNIGKNSMSIYLMHILAIGSFRIVLHKFMGIESLFAHLALGTMIGLLLPVTIAKIAPQIHLGFILTLPEDYRLSKLMKIY